MKYKHEKEFDGGYNAIIEADKHKEMKGMEFGVVELKSGDVNKFCYSQETVYDLLSGEVEFKWDGKSAAARRGSCFHEGAQVLHVPYDTEVEIACVSETAEIAVCRIANTRKFEARFLKPEDCLDANEMRGAGMMNDCASRIVRTFFDRSNCPETNFFIGEVVNFPGKWSSYPPHVHEEPEMYYYKMLPENGFGLSMYHGGAEVIEDNDLLGFESMTLHSQVVAPGYAMYYLWCIPLREDKNIDTIVVDEYKWVADPNAKYFPEI